MDYIITGAVITSAGKIRDNNEDNYYFNDIILSQEHSEEEMQQAEFSNKNYKAFAIFDGMGGQSNGERASFLAAETLKEYQTKNTIIDWNDFTAIANDKICNEMKNQNRMGTTMAGIQFCKDKVRVSNLGDSRIYLLSKTSFGQISEDHTEKYNKATKSKPRLTQYLGIRKDEMIIQPFIKEIPYDTIEKIMICSDGITDMVSNNRMEEILIKEGSAKECVAKLLQEALDNGGEDNTTVMVFQIEKNAPHPKGLKETLDNIWKIIKS